MKFEIVEGWTGDLDFDLLADGALPAGSMSGMSVELILKKADGTQLTTTGDVAIADEDNWRVRYSPDPGDLVRGSYQGRFKVTDIGGKIVYFPSGAWDQWLIRAEA